MPNKVEILAPAGSWDSLKAAAAAGADAVYFGSSSFNARRNAHNFTDKELPDVVSYCHARGIKTHLTLNTLVFDKEIDDAVSLVKNACFSGIDAIILQDLGLASIVRKTAPDIEMHASTQLSCHNIDGVRELANLGFSRVVLSRELSIKEIEAIAKVSPIELEVFVHGALCMSVSGQCYMSAFFGGCRSANRGLCAQPCRLPFKTQNNENVLSLKDVSIIDDIKKLSEIGVVSFKIEGRMKRPEYVYAATFLCKKAASGEKVTQNEKSELQNIFSRSGFTDGYLNSHIDNEMFGVRNREDVVSAPAALKKIRAIYDGVENQRIKVDFKVNVTKEFVKLSAFDEDGFTAEALGAPAEKAIIRAIDEKTVAEKISKTGSTPFYPGKITAEIEDGLTVPVSLINGLRREVLESLLKERSRINPLTFDDSKLREPRASGFFNHKKIIPKIRLCVREVSQIPENIWADETEIIFVPITQVKHAKELTQKGFRVGVMIPRALFGGTEKIEAELKEAKKEGITDALCSNIGALDCARRTGLRLHGDFGLNITNSQALEVYSKEGIESAIISFETPIDYIRDIKANSNLPCGIIVFGKLPLMLVRNCPVRSFEGCRMKGCSIKDRLGCEFPLICDHRSDGASQILNSRPVYLADHKKEIANTGVDFINFFITTETKAQVEQAVDAWNNEKKFGGEFTRGLYFKKVD